MIYLYIGLIVGLSIYDVLALKKEKLTKDIFVLLGSMVLVAIFGLIYLSNNSHPSIASYLLEFFKIKG